MEKKDNCINCDKNLNTENKDAYMPSDCVLMETGAVEAIHPETGQTTTSGEDSIDGKMQEEKTGEKETLLDPKPSLWQIFKLFFKIGSVGFGGGPALISIIQQEVTEKHKWLPEEEYLQGMAVSLMPPGSIMVNIAFFVGHYLRGFWGGFLALSGILLPSFVLMVILAIFLVTLKGLHLQTNAVKGMAPAVVGVIVALVIRMSRQHIDKWWGIVILAATVLMIFYMKTPPYLLVFLAMAIGGAGWIFIERKKSGDA